MNSKKFVLKIVGVIISMTKLNLIFNVSYKFLIVAKPLGFACFILFCLGFWVLGSINYMGFLEFMMGLDILLQKLRTLMLIISSSQN